MPCALRQHGVRVAPFGGDELREGDHAAAAGDVDDPRIADDVLLLQRLRDRAGDLILAAAGPARRDHLQPVHLREC